MIKAKGVRTCLTINPDIDVKRLVPYLDKVDMVLLMSVFAGFGGQKFIPETMDKIRYIKAEIDRRNLPTLIEIDGGVNTADDYHLRTQRRDAPSAWQGSSCRHLNNRFAGFCQDCR